MLLLIDLVLLHRRCFIWHITAFVKVKYYKLLITCSCQATNSLYQLYDMAAGFTGPYKAM